MVDKYKVKNNSTGGIMKFLKSKHFLAANGCATVAYFLYLTILGAHLPPRLFILFSLPLLLHILLFSLYNGSNEKTMKKKPKHNSELSKSQQLHTLSAIEKNAIGVKWLTVLRYGYAQSHHEYLLSKGLKPTDKKAVDIIKKAAELLILCSAKDGLDPQEKEFVLGFAVAANYDDEIINFIINYSVPPTTSAIDARLDSISNDINLFFNKRSISYKRNLIFITLLAVDADGITSDVEYDKVKEIAMRWGIKPETVDQIRELIKEQFELQLKRTRVIFQEVHKEIPAQRPLDK